MTNEEVYKKFLYYSGKKYDGFMGRCYRPKDASYKNYGERGIRVCSEWIKSIDSFRDWLKSQLSEMKVTTAQFISNSRNYQLDRSNTDGHYTPENCRIVSSQKNSRNKRTSVLNKIESAEGEIIDLMKGK